MYKQEHDIYLAYIYLTSVLLKEYHKFKKKRRRTFNDNNGINS